MTQSITTPDPLRPCKNGRYSDFLVEVLRRMEEGTHTAMQIKNFARHSWPFKRKLTHTFVAFRLAGDSRVKQVKGKNCTLWAHVDYFKEVA